MTADSPVRRMVRDFILRDHATLSTGKATLAEWLAASDRLLNVVPSLADELIEASERAQAAEQRAQRAEAEVARLRRLVLRRGARQATGGFGWWGKAARERRAAALEVIRALNAPEESR